MINYNHSVSNYAILVEVTIEILREEFQKEGSSTASCLVPMVADQSSRKFRVAWKNFNPIRPVLRELFANLNGAASRATESNILEG